MVINKDDGTGEAQAFAEAVGIPVLAAIPADDDIRRKSANYEIVGKPAADEWGRCSRSSPPTWPRRRRSTRRPLDQDGLLGLFDGKDDRSAGNVDARTRDRGGHARQGPSERPRSYEDVPRGDLDASRDECLMIATLRCTTVDSAHRAARCGRCNRHRHAAASGCHGGERSAREAACRRARAKSLDRYAKDYPVGPHDQPQSMCPAFGSLRVGLRMRRTATILSARPAASTASPSPPISTAPAGPSATSPSTLKRSSPASFSRTSAMRSRTGRPRALRRDRRDQPLRADGIGRTALRCCRNEINGVRIVGIDVPGFGVPTHAEAKDILAGAMLALRPRGGRARPVQCAARRRRQAGPPDG